MLTDDPFLLLVDTSLCKIGGCFRSILSHLYFFFKPNFPFSQGVATIHMYRCARRREDVHIYPANCDSQLHEARRAHGAGTSSRRAAEASFVIGILWSQGLAATKDAPTSFPAAHSIPAENPTGTEACHLDSGCSSGPKPWEGQLQNEL